jgi:hypothetical protein
MERDWLSLMTKIATGGLMLALVVLLAYALLPAMLGSEIGGLLSFLPIISMLIILLSLLVIIVAWFYSMYEIATAKNDKGWKALWLLVVFLLGIIGLVIYQMSGRKQRKI